MTFRHRPVKVLWLFAILVTLQFEGFTSLYAQEAEDSQLGRPARKSMTPEGHVFNQENKQSSLIRDEDKPPQIMETFGYVLFVLLLMGVIASLVIRYNKQGKLNFSKLKPIDTDNRLMILETKMLGSRQFLTVVEYNGQKILLGVSPGRVEQLCFLESVYEEEMREADFQYNEEENLA